MPGVGFKKGVIYLLHTWYIMYNYLCQTVQKHYNIKILLCKYSIVIIKLFFQNFGLLVKILTLCYKLISNYYIKFIIYKVKF